MSVGSNPTPGVDFSNEQKELLLEKMEEEMMPHRLRRIQYLSSPLVIENLILRYYQGTVPPEENSVP